MKIEVYSYGDSIGLYATEDGRTFPLTRIEAMRLAVALTRVVSPSFIVALSRYRETVNDADISQGKLSNDSLTNEWFTRCADFAINQPQRDIPNEV